MSRTTTPRRVLIYADRAGSEPFTGWLNGLKDRQSRHRILARLRRLEQGNFGDRKHLKSGVFELRLFFGTGYRVYFGEDKDRVIVLLCGGDKRSQDKDIENALSYWKEYRKS